MANAILGSASVFTRTEAQPEIPTNSANAQALNNFMSLKLPNLFVYSNWLFHSKQRNCVKPMAHWLYKTEPDVFGIDDLKRQGTATWEGVRNYQARNFLRQARLGDIVLIYHSSCKQVGIAGLAEVVREAYPDPTQFDPGSDYFDPASKPDNPRWSLVEVRFVRKLPRIISLDALRAMPALAGMALVKKGSRLSVMPVSEEEWQAIAALFEQATG